MFVMMWLGESVLSVFYPRVCVICGQRMDTNEHICADCMHSLPRTEHATLRNNRLEDLFVKDNRFVRGAAFLFYDDDGSVRRLIHELKYAENPWLAYELAHAAALEYATTDFFEGIDSIVPIPLHPHRLRTRGYNQSLYIAKGLSDVTNIPIDVQHLSRVRNNPQQALKVGEERERNVVDIFKTSYPEEMYRKHILLVDDVITSGLTIRSAMNAMKTFKGCSISVFTLVHSKR